MGFYLHKVVCCRPFHTLFSNIHYYLLDTYWKYNFCTLVVETFLQMLKFCCLINERVYGKCLLLQVGGRAVGFISVTSEVDLSLLDQNFQLEAFHGLCRPSEEDEIKSIHLDSGACCLGLGLDTLTYNFSSSAVHPTSIAASSVASATGRISQLHHR